MFRLITAGTVEEKRYEKQIHKDGIRRTILTNTGNNTAKYFTKEELRKKVFILGEEGNCEFLDKLQKRGFAYDETKNPEHTYSSLDGVIGQSSHDIVYSLPENFHLEESIKSPSQQPFSSPPSAAQWFSTKNKPVVVSGSKTSLSNKKESMQSPQQPFSSPPSGTKWIASKVIDGGPKASLPSKEDTCGGKENLKSTEKSKSNNIQNALVEKCLAEAKGYYRFGRKVEAANLLMDLLQDTENKKLNLSESDRTKVHCEMAKITNDLGWLLK